MDERIIQSAVKSFESMTTEELTYILNENDTSKWTPEAFEAIHRILHSREISHEYNRVDKSNINVTTDANAKYDRNIIYQYTDMLYMQATLVIIYHTILGMLVGGVLGYICNYIRNYYMQVDEISLIIGSIILFSFIGLLNGLQKAFWLKLQAQLALCQVQIEINTRISDKN